MAVNRVQNRGVSADHVIMNSLVGRTEILQRRELF
jgi:hypothetical protein